jgi:hypothetical protein
MQYLVPAYPKNNTEASGSELPVLMLRLILERSDREAKGR